MFERTSDCGQPRPTGARAPGEISICLPVGEVSALRGWAGLFGRGLADEVRIAVQLHLMQHAARHLGEVRDEIESEGVDPDGAAGRIRARLEERERTAYTRPSTAGLVARETLDEPNFAELGG